MKSSRARILSSNIAEFFTRNKKPVICFCITFFIGLVIGIISAINSCGGEFERIARPDMEFGAVKVFFFSILFLLLGYGVVLVSGYGTKLVIVSVLPFVALGVVCGEYACLLIACYETIGILNLLLVYLPFFLCSFVLLMLGAIAVLRSSCGGDCECGGRIRPSFLELLKFYGINVAVCFVIFIIIGSMTKVVIVSVW